MLNNKKGDEAVKIIFMLVFMFMILIPAYVFLANLFGTGPEYEALKSLQDVIDIVCADGGPNELMINIYLPEDNGAQGREDYLWEKGIRYFYIETMTKKVLLKAEDYPANGKCEMGWQNWGEEGCPTVKEAELECRAEVEYACIRPSKEGVGEDINIKVSKEKDEGGFIKKIKVRTESRGEFTC